MNEFDKWSIGRVFWYCLGMILLGFAYVGLVTPGIPFSIPLTMSERCFVKSSNKWHEYLMNHRKFGPFLKNWSKRRIFPKYAKISMVIVMCTSILFTYIFTRDFMFVGLFFVMCLCVTIWGLKYPSTRAEHDERLALGKKIAWLK